MGIYNRHRGRPHRNFKQEDRGGEQNSFVKFKRQTLSCRDFKNAERMPTVVEASQSDVFSVRPARALSAARHNARAFYALSLADLDAYWGGEIVRSQNARKDTHQRRGQKVKFTKFKPLGRKFALDLS